MSHRIGDVLKGKVLLQLFRQKWCKYLRANLIRKQICTGLKLTTMVSTYQMAKLGLLESPRIFRV